MKEIIFDTGVIINLAMNNLLWVLPKLKKQYGGDFIITKGIEKELIKTPLQSRKFKLEAIQVLNYINDKTIKIVETSKLKNMIIKIDKLANSCFFSHDKAIKIVHLGEIEALAYTILNKSEAILIDERIMRELIESPHNIQKVLKRRLHRAITVDNNKLKELKLLTKGIKVLRSTELIIAANDLNLFDSYINPTLKKELKNPKREILDSLLWGLKLHGCSINDKEINYIEEHEL